MNNSRRLQRHKPRMSAVTRSGSPLLGDEAWAAPAGRLGCTLVDLQAYSACQALLIYSMVITTFPRACPSSRYRIACGVSPNL
jgi:hypothetical protein